ncbi:PAS domain-containing protein [Hydrogenophaga sp. BPS33]|uniref:PAS domain-containing protein n=1 Tax=Hydrogenophaga sp. BPS33 TaxID=2651974 RepID=UPI00131FAC8D|nr:PAS domain-containing protein [Hydrogenophaga sp. BPS33]QHE88175.1 PAS domain-containing protein [Hydrogenophaga sp. BPS33]
MKPVTRLLSIPARWLAPLLLAAFALTTTAINLALEWRDVDQQVTDSETRRLRERLSVEQSRLSVQVGNGNPLVVRRLVGGLGLYGGMQHAYLVNPQGQVQASLNRADIGRAFADLQDQPGLALLAPAFATPLTGATLQVARPAGSALLLGRAVLEPGHELLTVVDLSQPIATRIAGLRAQMLRESVVLAVLVGALALLLHWVWFRRAEQLARALTTMGEGQLQARSGLQGRDELALIGAAADRMAERLQASHSQLQRMTDVVERSPLVVIEWFNVIGCPIHYVSPSIAQWGYAPEPLLQGRMTYDDLIHPDDVGRVNAEIDHYLEHGPDQYRQEYRLRCADGRWIWIDDRSALTRNAEGKVTGISGVLLDITVQKEAEIAQREQAEFQRLFYELPLIGMAISSPNSTHWLQVNDRLCEILGYPREELLKMRWADMTPEPDLERNIQLLDRMKAGLSESYQMHKRFVRWDGSFVHTEIHVRAVREPDGRLKHLFSIVQDITERLQTSQALSDQKGLLEQAEAMAGLGSWLYDTNTQRIWWSRQMYRNIGREEGEGPPPDLGSYLDCLHPEDRARVERFMQALPHRGRMHAEFRRHPALGRERWFRASVECRALADEAGFQYSGTLLDITQLRQAQTNLERINAKLEQRVAERTAQLSAANRELEAFSYTVSHDLKAPLRGIDGYSQLLEEEHAGQMNDEGRQFVGRIRRGVQQMATLISDLLDYSRMERRAMEPQAVELRPLVDLVLESHAADIASAGTEVRLQLDPMTLRLDRDGLAVVLRNLVGNAIKFSASRDQPHVEVGARTEGGRHILWVKDNGVGFDMQYHDRIFGIFQRLQRAEDYAGTGVGLALVAKAVQRMGGRVWADSSLGQGATFYLEFRA